MDRSSIEQMIKDGLPDAEVKVTGDDGVPTKVGNFHRYEPFSVAFRELEDDEIERYLDREARYDCAGSFKLEGAGFVLFESVKTDDPTALIGLPMIWVADRLLQLGYLSP